MARSAYLIAFSFILFNLGCSSRSSSSGGLSGAETSSTHLSDQSVPDASPSPTIASNSPSSSVKENEEETPTQKLVLDQIISVFENSTTQLQYAYVDAEDDGRGYTAGRAGFTSRDGDLLAVIQYYTRLNPETPLKGLIPRLQALNAADSGSLAGLSSLPTLWAQATEDPKFLEAQDHVSDLLYFLPAMQRVNKLNIKTQVGILAIYDAAIEHGVDGVDGVDDMINKMGNLSQYHTETELLSAFLAIRRATLLNPADPSTQEVWSASVGRVDTMQTLLDSGNLSLAPPISIQPFGDTFVITGSH